jgi:hypothetical protein
MTFTTLHEDKDFAVSQKLLILRRKIGTLHTYLIRIYVFFEIEDSIYHNDNNNNQWIYSPDGSKQPFLQFHSLG